MTYRDIPSTSIIHLRYGPFRPPIGRMLVMFLFFASSLATAFIPGIAGTHVQCTLVDNAPICQLTPESILGIRGPTVTDKLRSAQAEAISPRTPLWNLVLTFEKNPPVRTGPYNAARTKENLDQTLQFIDKKIPSLSLPIPLEERPWSVFLFSIFATLLFAPSVIRELYHYEILLDPTAKELRVRRRFIRLFTTKWLTHSLQGLSSVQVRDLEIPRIFKRAGEVDIGQLIELQWSNGSVVPLTYTNQAHARSPIHESVAKKIAAAMQVPYSLAPSEASPELPPHG